MRVHCAVASAPRDRFSRFNRAHRRRRGADRQGGRRQVELDGPGEGPISMAPWILVVVAVFAVVAYFMVMRLLLQRSRELDKQVDFTKIRPWKDEEN